MASNVKVKALATVCNVLHLYPVIASRVQRLGALEFHQGIAACT